MCDQGSPSKLALAEPDLLVAGAAVARVLLPLVAPAHTADWLVVAAAAWAVAFALYLWVFTPWLLSSRLDGKDG